jgi:phospholipid N-methyltransferase
MQNQISFSSEYLGAIPVSLFDPCQKGDFMTYTATYSPDDNKIRIYGPRFDEETYARVKAAGFRWAPKQELWVAPGWSPNREDLAIELAGQIDDEDKSLVERAEERSERFEDYSENRMADAERARKAVSEIADNIPFGQPILCGHHSEKHARADAKRIENGMRKAVNMWKQSEYWSDRAAGCLRNAKHKELPTVRARRIKGLEADLRKVTKEKQKSEKELAAWKVCAGTNDPEKQRAIGLHISNYSGYWSMSFPLADYPRDPPASQYEGAMGLWSAIEGNVITAAQAAAIAIRGTERYLPRAKRWIDHYENRLAYERAMLGEIGGIETDKTKPQVGGAIQSWHFASGWSYITKVNKVTVTVLARTSYGKKPYRANVPFDKVRQIMSAAEVNMAKQEGRVREVAAPNEVVVGFHLADLEPAPAPESVLTETYVSEQNRLYPQAFEAMQASLKAGIKVETVNQLFPTPNELAQEVADLADIQPGDRVLEPSAGTGMLLGALSGRMFGHNPECGQVTAVEINKGLADRLQSEYPLTRVIWGDFLEVSLGSFNKIVMNPPFENGADIKHIKRAYEVLMPGGRIVAICANGPRQQAQLKPLATEWRDLPADTFRQAGTGVNTALLVIEKPQTSS